MGRVYNFSAGPAVLPEEVLREAADEMLDYKGTGMSVMEMSHRSAAFKGIIEEAEADLRELMNIPDNYHVLFLQGGATQQFAAIPMNLMLSGKADYIVSGSWSKKAYKEAKIFGDALLVDDLVKEEWLPNTPTIMRYKTQVDAGSMSNTPPCYGIYICGKVFKWLKAQGGLEAMKKRNEEKAALLYDYLDSTDFYTATARKEDRSIMNVPFVTGDADLDAEFVAGAKKVGIENIKGHRTVGGMRASIYNAMPIEGVQALVEYMKEFEKAHS